MSSFHLCKQKDSMQCGIACLSMICSYYNKEYSVDTLSQYCFATTEGVSLLGMSKAADKLGLHSICAKLSITQLLKVGLPCILHWNQNHFVVLYKVKNNKKFFIADPGKGLITYSLDEFKQHWIATTLDNDGKGIAMLLEPTDDFGMLNEQNNTEKRSLKFLLALYNILCKWKYGIQKRVSYFLFYTFAK